MVSMGDVGEVRVRLNVVVQHSGAMSTMATKKDVTEGEPINKETQATADIRSHDSCSLSRSRLRLMQERCKNWS